MKNSLCILLLLIPYFGFAQYALINEVGRVEESPDSVWVEFYVSELQVIDRSQLKLYFNNRLIWFPDTEVSEDSYFSIVLDADLVGQNGVEKSVFSPGHIDLELIYNSSLLHAAPMKCIPEGSSLMWQGFSFVYSAQPSRNQENNDQVLALSPVQLDLNFLGGSYDESVDVLVLNNLNQDQSVHWNKGEVPVKSSSDLFPSTGLRVQSGDGGAAELAYIEASGYQIEPLGTIATAEVRSFQVFEKGCPVSEVSRNTYFIGSGDAQRYNLPIVSITTNDAALFGAQGIYGYGESGINFDLRGKKWEKPATIEYFEGGELKLQQNIGLRIRGKSSRYSPQKSFKVYAREEYGKKKLDNVFFPSLGDEKLKRINLRTPHNDFINSLLTDHVAMQLAKSMNVDAPKSKRCVMYLNGEFWGLYTLQESIDEHFPETNYNVDDEDVLIVDSDQEWPAPYADILNYVKVRTQISDDDLIFLEDRIDLPSMMEYYALQIYLANWDWPQKNVKAWLSSEGEPLRYFFFDGDACFNRIDHPSIERFYPDLNTLDHSNVFSALMTNSTFRSEFMSVLLSKMRDDFSAPNVLAEIGKAEQEIDHLMNDQIARWGYPQSKIAWENSVQSMNLFAIYRQAELMESIESLFGSLVKAYPSPMASGSTLYFDSFGMFSSDYDYQIFDLSGRVVAEGQSSNDQIDNLQLESGSYIALLNANGFSRPSKFTVD